MRKTRVRVWDLPTRLFHWLLAGLVVAAYVTGQLGGSYMEWHGRVGIAIVGLLSFRLVWGVIGSTYARFSDFVPGPAHLWAHLRGHWSGLGHNPLGALSVLALLGVMLYQAVTGLFANDEIAFSGPLRALVSADTSNWLSGLHRQNYWPIIILVGLHVGAVLFYALIKKDNLVGAMITGHKDVDEADAQPAQGGGLVALLIALAITAGVLYVATGSFIEPPPPPPVAPW
ncbi:MAG TPA: cytochrome b/b6 domain-containing protein [Thauera sp.]|uniref:cytochrome b/b6 domain-containing protein n=1 Tax=Thauera sp. TaxID=1905334 RepID=UPI002B65AEEC|nr:cytochrome b/b6 domain-containing protein [Thauera sp.]HRP26715.1 cytochrome b/b6 domain-containing protein [Thauera sp.]HRP67615.1 cytochrome b/b6 domain-containing protein [Thauera sp.]